jgi:hypothetical protein
MPTLFESLPLPSPLDDRDRAYAARVDVDGYGEHTLRAAYHVEVDGKPGRSSFAQIDLKTGVVAITGAEVVIATKYLVCLGGCGLSHLVKEIMTCRRAGHQRVEDIIRCLRDKLGPLADDLIACAAGCVVTV